MKRTIERYLFDYCNNITEVVTQSVRKIYEVSRDEPYLWMLMPLFSLHSKMKQEQLLRVTNDEFKDKINALSKYSNLNDFNDNYNGSNPIYKEFLESYKNIASDKQQGKEDKETLRLITLEKINKAEISKYSVYTNLGINQGNFNDFYKNGNFSKLSFQIIMTIDEYLNDIIER